MKLLFSLSVLSSKKEIFPNLCKPRSARDRTGARRASATRAAICVLYSATLSLPLFRGDRGGLPSGQQVYSSHFFLILLITLAIVV